MLNVLLLVFGFGFVIFFHELGHFLAAKWADVRVEQFAVGFGQALLSWRKGIGFRFGNTQADYTKKVRKALEDKVVDVGPGDMADGTYSDAQLAAAGTKLGLGETEYRLNWIPLGGYVKMVGQDDLDPNATSIEPRAYNRKSIGKRMVIVSAGVIMNIILAFIGFMILFRMGFHAPAAVVGDVIPNSPAQLTKTLDGQPSPLEPGDAILTLNDQTQYDFTKVLLTTALLRDDHSTTITIRKRGSNEEKQLLIQPAFDQSGKFLMMGIRSPQRLQVNEKFAKELQDAKLAREILPPEWLKLQPGDQIIQVNGFPQKGQDIGEFDYGLLDAKIQLADGKPVDLTWQRTDGKTFQMEVQPHFEDPFGAQLNIAGMVLPSMVHHLTPDSVVIGKIRPDDQVLAVIAGDKRLDNPSQKQASQFIFDAHDAGNKVQFVVRRAGEAEPITTEAVAPSLAVDMGKRGVGVGLAPDEQRLVIAEVQPNSPAAQAGIVAGSHIQSVAGTPVQNWFEVRRLLVNHAHDGPVKLQLKQPDGTEKSVDLSLTPEQITWMSNLRLSYDLPLAELIVLRKTTNMAQAAWWGLVETKDFVAQFYLTIRRMVEGRVSLSNMQGPVGIFSSGTTFAERGGDWLLWFLCMISANLAVVNFLPIPIVDGGLFTFLIIEKIQGKPLSPRAQSIAQYVGLTFLISVFLIVTFMDIRRMLML